MLAHKDEIYKMAREILGARGEIVPHNLIRVMSQYQDDNIMIEGLFPFDYQSPESEPYEFIRIALRLPSDSGISFSTQDSRFALPPKSKTDEAWTEVYVWYKATLFSRPGYWQAYLRQLMAQIEREREIIQELNKKPIDDSSLFPDLS